MPFTIVPVHYEQMPPAHQKVFEHGMRKPYDVQEPLFDDNDNLIFGWVVMPDSSRFFLSLNVEGIIVKRVKEEDTDPVMNKFGMFDINVHHLPSDKAFYNWLISEIITHYDHLVSQSKDCTDKDYGRLIKGELRPRDRLTATLPRRSKEYPGKISVYKTVDARTNDYYTAMRIGRFFKFLFPELDDSQVESFVDKFRHRFSDKELTLTVSGEAKQFRKAYASPQAQMENPYTTFSRKSLACSCMRYDFEHLEHHPVEAYASGDFKIIYTEDNNGLINSRCVIYTNHPSNVWQAGPIYGVCETSIDKIETELVEQGADLFNNAEWLGARLRRTEHCDGGFVAPYLDVEPRSLEDDGTHLVVSRYGEIDASDYSGLLGAQASCPECGSRMYEDTEMYSEYMGMTMCEDCFYEYHFYCDHTGEYFHNDEGVTVFASYAYGTGQEEIVSPDDRNDNYILCKDGEFWNEEDAIWCEYEEEYISPRDIEDYFYSEVDCEWYPNEIRCDYNDMQMTIEQFNEIKDQEKEEEKCTA